MTGLRRCWAAVCDVFTAVPADSHGRRPPRAAAVTEVAVEGGTDEGDYLARLRTHLLRHPCRLAAACLATVVGPAVVAQTGSLDVSPVSEVHAGAGATPAPLPDPVPGDGATWLPVAREAAATCPGLPSAVLVAIGHVETHLGLLTGTSPAGAVGPMQFLPATWAAYGTDGNGDGVTDVMNPVDAVHGAARLLCANGGGDPDRLHSALWNYNHSDEYVRQVMAVARFVPAES
ncbi:MAG: lytic transglycosylase domain-containing protein [Acidimicrobiales bacterium]